MTIFYERTEEWGRVGVEGESGVDFMGGFGWGGQRTISSRRGSLLIFVGGVFFRSWGPRWEMNRSWTFRFSDQSLF